MMRRDKWLLGFALLMPLVFVGGSDVSADMPDTFKNLQILPENISKDELKGIMDGFTEMLDVKCSYCHIPDEYHKDDKEHKRITRDMMLLVDNLRSNIGTYFPKDTEPEVIGCWMCHRGSSEIEPYAAEEGEDW